jgi:glycosyltransferase involved in cell wall biosynthesis
MLKFRIIIPIHNPPDCFLETLSALRNDGLEGSVIVVDDGSTNGIAQKIRDHFGGVEVLQGDGNLWWAGGMRMGMARALELNADVISWLNHDCVPHPGTVAALVEEASKPGMGAVSAWCVTSGFDDAPVNPGFRNFRPIPVEELIGSDKVIVDGVNGNCVAMNADAIRNIGLPDQTRHPHYGDGPYTWRLHKAGYANAVLTRRHASLSRELERCIDEESHSMVWDTDLVAKFRYYLFSPRSKFHWKNKFHDLQMFRGKLAGLALYPLVQTRLLLDVAKGHRTGKKTETPRIIEEIVKRYRGRLPEQGLREALTRLSQRKP